MEQPLIKVERSTDWEYFDSVFKKPEMFSKVADDRADITKPSLRSFLASSANVGLRVYMSEQPVGFFLFVNRGFGVYEVHTCLEKPCRGKEAIIAGGAGCDFMFTRTDCVRLVSLCPHDNMPSKLFANAVGFKEDWIVAKGMLRNGAWIPSTMVSFTVSEWVRLAEQRFRPGGKSFHDALFQAAPQDKHEDDATHDGMVGVVLLMAMSGHADKGQRLYNEWASMAGYQPIEVMGEIGSIKVVNIRSMLIGLTQDGQVHVLAQPERREPCQSVPL
jgi:RimJ/RimL family protein N-acetyltransferase